MSLWLRVRLLQLGAILTFPFFLIAFLLILVMPDGMGFNTEFEVENQTAESIDVTPIGAVGSEGRRCLLPLAQFKPFYIPPHRRSEFLIEPHSKRTFIYDWDDVQFTEILFRPSEGDTHRMITTGLHPTDFQYRRPQQTLFVIATLEEGEPAGELQLAALPEHEVIQNLGRLITLFVLSLVTSPLLWSAAKRMQRKAVS